MTSKPGTPGEVAAMPTNLPIPRGSCVCLSEGMPRGELRPFSVTCLPLLYRLGGSSVDILIDYIFQPGRREGGLNARTIGDARLDCRTDLSSKWLHLKQTQAPTIFLDSLSSCRTLQWTLRFPARRLLCAAGPLGCRKASSPLYIVFTGQN